MQALPWPVAPETLTLQPKPIRSHSMNFALALLAVLWILIANRVADSATNGLAGHLPVLIQPLLEPVILLFLLLVGLTGIAQIGSSGIGLRLANALPRRVTGGEERQRGFALGWAIALAAVLPMMCVGALQPEFSMGPRNWLPTAISIFAIGIGTLAAEVAFRGFLYAKLTAAFGTVAGTIAAALIFALASILHPNSNWLTVAGAFFAGLLLCVAWQRTNAIWLGWGLHFGWAATTAVLLGLPTAGDASLSSLVTTSASGADWLTGGPYGPDGAVFTIVVRLLALVPLYHLTRDYAWRYTHEEILSGGIPVVIAPPAAHTEMEEAAAAKPAALVQILSTTSTSSSTMPVIEEHLRRDVDSSDRD